MKLALHPRISQDPKIMVGKPRIAGARIPVDLILRMLAHGETRADLHDAYDLTDADIDAALDSPPPSSSPASD